MKTACRSCALMQSLIFFHFIFSLWGMHAVTHDRLNTCMCSYFRYVGTCAGFTCLWFFGHQTSSCQWTSGLQSMCDAAVTACLKPHAQSYKHLWVWKCCSLYFGTFLLNLVYYCNISCIEMNTNLVATWKIVKKSKILTIWFGKWL